MSIYDGYKTSIPYVGKVKVILVGEIQVGKTNIITRYVNDAFKTDNLTTSSPSLFPKYINIEDENYKINLWDTAGQEIYHSLTKIFLQNVHIAILVYAINDRKSFEKLNFWYNTVKECSEVVCFCLCANKSDLIDESVVEHEEGKKYAESIGANFYITSAKDLNDKNINLMFEEIITNYVKENREMLIESKNKTFCVFESGKKEHNKNERKNNCCAKKH